MGRDILASTALREAKLKYKMLDCELCHRRARLVQTIRNDAYGEADKKACQTQIFKLRVCKNHNYANYYRSTVLSVELLSEENKDTTADFIQQLEGINPEQAKFLRDGRENQQVALLTQIQALERMVEDFTEQRKN